MAIKLLIGTETEYGITAKKTDGFDPVSSSLFVINHLRPFSSLRILWDYENEDPLVDARGFIVEGEKERPSQEENFSLNKPLENGGRLYVDGAHPEYSTPECTNPRDIVIYEKAGEMTMQICMDNANRIRKKEDKLYLYKNNTDGKGNSYGYHENYLMLRDTSFERIVQSMTPFLVTRQIYAGSGKVGTDNKADPADYQISQRADFFETLIDLNTMAKRPIINTRDEPHADPKQFRRFHIIVGDANMSEFATYLKVGATALALHMVDNGHFITGLELANPLQAIKAVSRDLTLKKTVRLVNGKDYTPVEIQKAYLEEAYNYFNKLERDPVVYEIMSHWGDTLDKLEKDPCELNTKIDWLIKHELLTTYARKKGENWDNPRLAMMDLQYHDIRPDKGLYYTLMRDGYVTPFVSEGMIFLAKDNPPRDTRAFFRGMCIKRFPKEVYATSWSSVLFDIGNSTIKRVPLQNPLRGTEALVGNFFRESETAEDLLRDLSA
ncbi:MAG: proteasome accessory factor PafA2 [Nitrospirae bacterium]|nr:proteasome accessory factor PafA2 [Nitrospirota bacterium]